MIDRTLRQTRSTFDIYHSSYSYSGAAYTTASLCIRHSDHQVLYIYSFNLLCKVAVTTNMIFPALPCPSHCFFILGKSPKMKGRFVDTLHFRLRRPVPLPQ